MTDQSFHSFRAEQYLGERGHETALQHFIEDKESFAKAVLDSGILSSNGGFLSVELFENGSSKLRNENDYSQVTGRVLGIPYLSDEDYRDLRQNAGSSSEERLIATLVEEEWQLDHIQQAMECAFAEYEDL